MHAEGEVTQKIHQVFELWGSGLILHPWGIRHHKPLGGSPYTIFTGTFERNPLLHLNLVDSP